MATYTFYPTMKDGLASTFECVELPNDAKAMIHAETVLSEHLSAHSVVIWRDDRKVFTLQRRQLVGGTGLGLRIVSSKPDAPDHRPS